MRLLTLFLILLLWAAPQTVAAQTTIVAVVNGKPITSYDLRQRQALMRLTGVRGNVRQMALDELIDDAVRLAEADRYQVSASDAQVDRAIAGIAQRVKLSPSKLKQALGQSGVNINTLRDRLRAQIAFNSLTRARFRTSGRVSEQELVAALLKDDERENTIETTLYTLEQITIALPDQPSQQRLRRANARAEDLRKRFTSCRDGVNIARKTRNVVVKPFGKRLAPTLTPQVRAALEGVPVGRLSKPIQAPRGLVMFAVCDKETQRSTNAAMKEIEPTMEQERGLQFSQQYLRQLRRDAVIERR